MQKESRIGDWGTNGVHDIFCQEIDDGLHSAAGIDRFYGPSLVIDAGTNREELRNNPNYLGNRHERVRGDVHMTSLTNLFKQQNVSFLNSTFTGKTWPPECCHIF